jgi:hypothetical protein
VSKDSAPGWVTASPVPFSTPGPASVSLTRAGERLTEIRRCSARSLAEGSVRRPVPKGLRIRVEVGGGLLAAHGWMLTTPHGEDNRSDAAKAS